MGALRTLLTCLAATASWACGSASAPPPEAPEAPLAEVVDAEAEPATDPAPVDDEGEEVAAAPPAPPPVRRAPKPCVSRAAPGELRTLDMNSDGTTDVWEVTRGGTRFCREADMNFDGQPDLVTFYDSLGRQETRREMDLDFDGRPDVIEVRSGGVVHRVTVETTSP